MGLSLPIRFFCSVVVVIVVSGCHENKSDTARSDPKWEQAHSRALAFIERKNVLRRATDRSYYYPREVADLDSDGRYEAIVGWHPDGDPEGIDFLWQVIDDTMVMSEDSVGLARPRARMHFASGRLVLTSPIWNPTDSPCCPSRELSEIFSFSKGHVIPLSVDTIAKTSSRGN